MTKTAFIARLKHILTLILILWIVFILDKSILHITHMGIIPRTSSGLIGILFAPFIHANLAHIIANTVSLFILGLILINLDTKYFYWITFNVIIFGGFFTWLIGRSGSVHVGASGVIYGYLGYLIATGFFNKSVKTILVSLLVVLLYGGAVFGVLPSMRKGISWEGHLCGFVVGIILAKMYSRYYRR